jgi:putative oxidoreductase
VLFMGHGAQKLFGVFGGPSPAGFAGWLQGLGLRPARVWAIVAGICEFGGGLLFALGLITPIAALALLAVMLMAVATVHWTKGLWVTNGGYEYNLVLSAALRRWPWPARGSMRWTTSSALHSPSPLRS